MHLSWVLLLYSLAVLARNHVTAKILPRLSNAYRYVSDKIFLGESALHDDLTKIICLPCFILHSALPITIWGNFQYFFSFKLLWRYYSQTLLSSTVMDFTLLLSELYSRKHDIKKIPNSKGDPFFYLLVHLCN